MIAVGPLLLAGALAGLAAVERKALLQAQLSRPIVVAPLVGWALGDPLAGLYVGAPLELIWIGAANLGAALPPHDTAATAAVAAAAVGAGAVELPGAVAALAVLLFGPIAMLGRKLEGVAERANERLVAHAAAAIGEGLPHRAFRLHLRSLWRPFAATGALVIVAGGLVGPALGWIEDRLPVVVLAGLEIGWALLWAVGGAAAVRAARLPKGLTLAACGAAFAAAIWIGAEIFGWVGVTG